MTIDTSAVGTSPTTATVTYVCNHTYPIHLDLHMPEI